MIVTITTIGDAALAYARDRLANGHSLSRSVVPLLSTMAGTALLPGPVSDTRALDFEHGGLGLSILTDLTEMLATSFRGSILLLELPLWKPNDPGISSQGFDILVWGNEVYGTCELDEPLTGAERTLRAADPAIQYNAFVVRRTEARKLQQHPPAQWIERNAIQLEAVIIGAYDGEGFVLATRGPVVRTHEC